MTMTTPTTAQVDHNALVALRNTTPNPVVFSWNKDDLYLEWSPAGDQMGRDVQQVSYGVLRSNPSLMRQINLGILEIVSDGSEVESILLAQAEGMKREKQEAHEAVMDKVDKTGNDLIPFETGKLLPDGTPEVAWRRAEVAPPQKQAEE